MPGAEIAMSLFGAERALLQAEAELELLLYSLYGTRPNDWSSFEYDRKARRLDVYSVTPSAAAVDALGRAGFAVVCEHDHAAAQFTGCACRAHAAPRRGQNPEDR